MQKDAAERFTVTIHVAAPGTPRWGERDSVPVRLENSSVGHMFLTIDDGSGRDPKSYGYTRAPTPTNPDAGEVDTYDNLVYRNPRYERTIEVSREQYDKIMEFAEAPEKHGFDKNNYNLVTNACTDFAWGALNHAGLRPVGLAGEIRNYEGSIKVLDNIPAINAIPQQVKDSELDKVKWNDMPTQTFGQWWISQNGERTQDAHPLSGTPADPSHADHTRLNQLHQQVADLGAFGAQNGNVSASLLALSKEQQFTRVDDVLLGERRGDAAPNLFIVQGDRSDPAHQRASLPADVAAQTPVAASFERIEQLAQAQPQRDAQRQQEEQQLAQTHAPRMA
ncbi:MULTISPECIES: XVIPCD domain-containing protein [unclassified Stenotrophomonas]|uniref:XVIPCD domain-containing protein n=2 Tax=Stenotrophomonas TaxID=40323 RepID=UPI003F956DB6